MAVDLMDVSVWSVWLQTDNGAEQMAVLDYMGPYVLCAMKMVLGVWCGWNVKNVCAKDIN